MKLDKIKHTNSKYSLYWKLLSYKLLTKAKDKTEFCEAVLWCGKAGNVIRSVNKKSQSAFCEYVFTEKNEILKGTFDIFNCKSFNNKSPKSFVSKICHIMNPRMYPLIYDENVRKSLKIKKDKEFKEKEEEYKKKVRFWSRKRIYRLDSKMWAE